MQAILRNFPVFCGFTGNLAFFGHVCMVSLDVILILSRKVLFRHSVLYCLCVMMMMMMFPDRKGSNQPALWKTYLAWLLLEREEDQRHSKHQSPPDICLIVLLRFCRCSLVNKGGDREIERERTWIHLIAGCCTSSNHFLVHDPLLRIVYSFSCCAAQRWMEELVIECLISVAPWRDVGHDIWDRNWRDQHDGANGHHSVHATNRLHRCATRRQKAS